MTKHITKNFKSTSPKDGRDKIAKLTFQGELPSFVDMKPHVFEVEDQGEFSSCAANAGCSALELMYKRDGSFVDLSRMFLYFYAREAGGLEGDIGSYPRDIVKTLNKIGTCLESTWEYTDKNITQPPTDIAIKEAETYKVLSYEKINEKDQLSQIKIAVANGIPVLLAMTIHKSFSDITGEWKTHKWNTKTSTRNPDEGAHAVLVIGYDDESKRLLVENSWGPKWADGGFFGLPYSHVGTDLVGETWIVTPNLAVKKAQQKLTLISRFINFLIKLLKK